MISSLDSCAVLELSDLCYLLTSEVHLTCGWERPLGALPSAGRVRLTSGLPSTKEQYQLHFAILKKEVALRRCPSPQQSSRTFLFFYFCSPVHEHGSVEVAQGLLLVGAL